MKEATLGVTLEVFGDKILNRPAQHVDEAGRHRLSGCVNRPLGAAGSLRSKVGDLVVLDGDVAGEAGLAHAVVNSAAAD